MRPRLKQSFLDLTPSPRRLHSDRANKAIDAIKEQLSSHDHARTLIASRSPLTPPSSQTPPTLADSAMDPSYNLPDSTDWIATSIPSFEPLEAALRCEVCKEFYENPVITNCSHTFCSLCIRRCITSDGKCPTCKAANQADKLLPNFAVREIVNRFQEARSQALELARRDKSDSDAIGTTKKRKLEDTDIEEEEPVRQTRSRMTRTRSERTNGVADAPIQVPDSEDDGDADFVPDGMVKCPICSKPMKEELVWTHINSCTGEAPGSGRSTRSRTNVKHPPTILLQKPQQAEVPAPNRLPGLTYALLKESALKKKLQELGIPTSGKRELLIRRHTEWLHLWNSNCDASEYKRKSKRELLKELETWERIQGGNANMPEAKVMRKDFDGAAHANAHKTQFDHLIADARKKRERANQDTEQKEESAEDGTMENMQPTDTTADGIGPDTENQRPSSVDPAKPYEGNDEALATIRAKVEETNRTGHIVSPPHNSSLRGSDSPLPSTSPEGIHLFNPPTSIKPMFSLPASPVLDVESSTIQ